MYCTAGLGWRCGIPFSPGIGSPPSSQHFCHFNETAFEHISHFKSPERLWSPPSLIFNGYRDSPLGKKRRGRGFNHYPPCLRMGGVVPPLPKYAVMAGTRRTLLSYCKVVHHVKKFLVVSVHWTGRFILFTTPATGPKPEPDYARPRSKLPCARHEGLLFV
jgi:hypothetical protein